MANPNSNPNLHVAQLDNNELQRVRELEIELGVTVVALEPDPAFAELSAEQLHKLKAAERELNTVLLAYRPS